VGASRNSGCQQMHRIPTTIELARDRIEGHFESACLPWLLPWSRTLLQHSDDALGNFLTMISLLRGATAHSPLLPESGEMDLSSQQNWRECSPGSHFRIQNRSAVHRLFRQVTIGTLRMLVTYVTLP